MFSKSTFSHLRGSLRHSSSLNHTLKIIQHLPQPVHYGKSCQLRSPISNHFQAFSAPTTPAITLSQLDTTTNHRLSIQLHPHLANACSTQNFSFSPGLRLKSHIKIKNLHPFPKLHQYSSPTFLKHFNNLNRYFNTFPPLNRTSSTHRVFASSLRQLYPISYPTRSYWTQSNPIDMPTASFSVKPQAPRLQFEIPYLKFPRKGDEVIVHYTARLETGTVIDSTARRGKPSKLFIGQENHLLPGFDRALQLIPIGQHAEVIVPWDLAYGTRGLPGVVPPYSTILYDIELLQIRGKTREQYALLKALYQPSTDPQVNAKSGLFLLALIINKENSVM